MENPLLWGIAFIILMWLFLLATAMAGKFREKFPEGAKKLLSLATLAFVVIVVLVWEMLFPEGTAEKLVQVIKICTGLGTD
jgi:hypothetical protein